ncbi:hypothetical protein CC2G_010339 [Coprinopsis cinerea AmutBmut pab1-1]|nr:hypothetical protein CC2G_010339 [Coprinopsis cinerea AmutBmut pab1-1]
MQEHMIKNAYYPSQVTGHSQWMISTGSGEEMGYSAGLSYGAGNYHRASKRERTKRHSDSTPEQRSLDEYSYPCTGTSVYPRNSRSVLND